MNKNLLFAPSLDELLATTGSNLAIHTTAGVAEVSAPAASNTTSAVPSGGGKGDGSAPDAAELPKLEMDANELVDDTSDVVEDFPTIPEKDSDDAADDAEDATEVKQKKDEKKGKVSDDDFGDRLKDKTKKEEQKPKSNEKEVDVDNQPAQRDYTGFTPEETAKLRKMGNEAFAYVAPILREHKTLKPQIDRLTADLEAAKKSPAAEAYVDEFGYARLQPWTQAHQEVEQAQQFVDFYNQQLISLETTDSFVGLVVAPDGKSLQQVPIKCKDATEQATYRVQLLDIINSNRQKAAMAEQRKEQIKQQYTQNVASSQATIKAMEKKAFGKYIGQEDKNPYISTMRQTLNELGHMNNPLAGTITYMYATIQELAAEITKLRGAQKPAEQPAGTEQVTNNGKQVIKNKVKDPSSASIASGVATNGKARSIKATDDELAGRFGG